MERAAQRKLWTKPRLRPQVWAAVLHGLGVRQRRRLEPFECALPVLDRSLLEVRPIAEHVEAQPCPAQSHDHPVPELNEPALGALVYDQREDHYVGFVTLEPVHCRQPALVSVGCVPQQQSVPGHEQLLSNEH
eukprot:3125716-Rhodomonas_salina.4